MTICKGAHQSCKVHANLLGTVLVQGKGPIQFKLFFRGLSKIKRDETTLILFAYYTFIDAN